MQNVLQFDASVGALFLPLFQIRNPQYLLLLAISSSLVHF